MQATEPWAIVLVAPNSERKVASLLERYQFPAHIFWERTRVVFHGAIHERIKPLFSRYVFIKPDCIYDACRQISDIYRALVFGNELALVPAAVVQAIADSADDHGVLPYKPPTPRFQDGTKVVVTGIGSFAGRAAIYRRSLRHGRALIMVDLFGTEVPAEVDEQDLDVWASEKRRRRQQERKRQRRQRHRQRVMMQQAPSQLSQQ